MNELYGRSVGTGRLGVSGNPTKYRTTPELCPLFLHPPATYNPQARRTWCLCGSKTYPGNTATHVACCDGPLTEITTGWIAWQEALTTPKGGQRAERQAPLHDVPDRLLDAPQGHPAI